MFLLRCICVPTFIGIRCILYVDHWCSCQGKWKPWKWDQQKAESIAEFLNAEAEAYWAEKRYDGSFAWFVTDTAKHSAHLFLKLAGQGVGNRKSAMGGTVVKP